MAGIINLNNLILSTSNGVTLYYSVPKIYYERSGNNVTVYVSCDTYGTTWNDGHGGSTYTDAYIYNATLSVGGQTKTVMIKPSCQGHNVGTLNDYKIGTYTSSTITVASAGNTLSGTLTFNSSNGGGHSGSQNFSMNVAGPSTMSFTASGIALGSTLPITITRGNENYTHTLKYYASGISLTTITTGIGTSYNWAVPASLANAAPSSTQATVTIQCLTYDGPTLIGTTEANAVFDIPDNATFKPSASTLTVLPYNTNSTVGGWGVYLQGYSKASITVGGSAKYGASVASYTVSVGSTVVWSSTSTSGTSDTLNVYGNLVVSVVVTDSRGYQATKAETIYVYPYALPNVVNMSCYRCTQSGTAASNGTYIRAIAARSYSDVNSKNTCSMSIKYAVTGGTYSSPTSMSDNTAVIIGNGGIATTNTYTVVITVADALNSREIVVTIPTEAVTMNFKEGGTGVCFGGLSTRDNCFEIANASGWIMVISNGAYGSSLPASGVEGQIFFLLS